MMWTARVELFGMKRIAKWVLVDPKGGLIRAVFNGTAKDDKTLAPTIARLLNADSAAKKRKRK